MDKLKEILVYKFWILVGLALLFPLIGWWMATASIGQAYETRLKELDDKFKKIPPLTPTPNSKWIEPVQKINVQEAQRVDQTRDLLLQHQQTLMTWPKDVSDVVEELEYLGQIGIVQRELYRTAYDRELLATWKIVKPLDEDGEGLVDFPIETLPTDNWGEAFVPPTSEQMWKSQEDLWLLRSILNSIAAVNQDATTQLDAPIRQISMLELRGGSRNKAGASAPASAAPAAAGLGAVAAGHNAAAPAGGPAGLTGAGGMGRGGAGGSAASASFDPAEEFGSDAETDTGSAVSAPAAANAATPGANAGHMAAPPAGALSGGMGDRQGSGPRKRYIDETEEYKTRGFYLEVVMDHRELPGFLVELTNSEWPTRVVRVQQVDRDQSDVGSGAGGVGGLAGGLGEAVAPAWRTRRV